MASASGLPQWVVIVVELILLTSILKIAHSEVLEPPLFNIAQGKKITASHTCGENDVGQPLEELYCKLTSSAGDSIQTTLVQGQFCDICDKSKHYEGKNHPAEYAIDGSERWWQSPPLSRSMSMNEVNLTIDLGQEFHVAYVIVRMGNSPRPGIWVLERSSDDGKTYKPWQYFADTTSDCESYFGRESLNAISRDDSVICVTQYSALVPLEGGEVFVRLLDNRPSRHDFFSSDILQEFTRTTNIRLRLLRTRTLLGHLMSVRNQDSTVTRRYFYSIKDISIGGTCRCNGHADLCDYSNPRDKFKLVCVCQHNTCGDTCEYCCPGFVQRQWKAATRAAPFVCEACNCHGHSRDCYYDEAVDRNRTSLDMNGEYKGGGVCTNCRHNTQGINCNECRPGYHRPYGKIWNETDVCQPCQCDPRFHTGNCEEETGRCECQPQYKSPDCNTCSQGFYDWPTCRPCDCNFNGTMREICEVGGGECPCKPNFAGRNCDSCAENFFKFPDCLPCECNPDGSLDSACDPDDGQCECGNKFGGRRCDQCERGYFGYPNCKYCDCDVRGTESDICDKNSGTCICREGYGGPRCDQCTTGFFGYPDCVPCNCSAVGSSTTSTCDISGKCPCLINFSGRACDQCKPGYRLFPDCIPCNCDASGTMGVSCDDEGKCQCKPNFDDLLCNKCKENFYNYPDCEECNCDPAGTTLTFQGCKNSPPGELCECKERVQGRICNECKPLYWNLQHYNPLGCEDCDCHLPGVLGGVQICESKTGQCVCKPHVTSKRCDQCQDGYHNLNSTSLIGCEDCNCDPGGAETNKCNKISGECDCRPRIEGKRCTQPKAEHYYPTLFQFQYEAEDGATKSGGQVRFGYNDTLFPDYSWRGYAVYSQLQPETNHDVQIDKSSLYRVVFRYVNPTDEAIIGELTVAPEYSPGDIEQRTKVRFEPRQNFVTVSTGGIPSPYVLDPGRWRFTIKSDQYLLIDYFVLIPAAYYEGTILQKKITQPCLAKSNDESVPCVELQYPIFNNFDSKLATSSYISNNGGKTIPSKRYTDKKVLSTLDVKELVLLSPEQNRLNFDVDITKSGRFVVVVEYFTPNGIAADTRIQVDGSSKKGNSSGEAVIYDCQYSVMCREAVINSNGDVEIFRFDSPAKITLTSPEESTGDIMINSVTAIPWSKWSLDHIRPKEFCLKKDGDCVKTSFNLPPDSTKVEAEVFNEDRIADMSSLPPEIGHRTKFVVLNSDDRSVDISGKVPKPGEYVFVVHYYQPNYPEFTAETIIQNGQHYAARVPFSHCASIEGCRSQIAQEDGNIRFYVEDDFALTVTAPKDVWIDYVLAVAVPDDYRIRDYFHIPPRFMEHNRFEETARFLSECGQNHMYLPPDTQGFCRDSVFSLSVHYNNEALRCHCDGDGSHDFLCDVFGGQCNCKSNVIGRRCERCRTGYFGFPDCKPCDCPSTALCDPNTGECICPKNVIGAQCDTCAPYSYGFDALIGCEDCACNEEGVRGRYLQCDLNNGTCTCRENVVGRTCDSCLAGHWLFPECRFCGCDPRGTTEQICNQATRECYCKQFVASPGYCDTCQQGTFNLEERNPNGCTKCFCFGKTTRCASSRLRTSLITVGKSDWSALTINPKETSFLTNVINHNIEIDDSAPDDAPFVPVYMRGRSIPSSNETQTLYFRAQLNGNFLTSYGGMLRYSLISEPSGRDTFGAADIIIEGRELAPSEDVIRLYHFSIDHLDGENTMNMNLPVREENFLVESSGTAGLVSATRDQLMIALRGLTSIYIRGTYWKQTREVRLASFSLDVAVESDFDPGDARAVAVEECTCPRNYIGLSCEECAPGYYRATSGPFGGHCVPCNCNRHADSCDPVSGVCHTCRDNTRGDHCEKCELGYHGDATQGTPYDCLICACPLPIPSNNFATSCEFSRDGSKVSCECKENYFGLLCESCNPGHFGSPETPGDYCKPCQCSGNIDMRDPQSCDTVTGACLRCMNNTGGPACNLCKRGYFGDALIAKDCDTCTCDKCGTQECNSYTGECACLSHVIGVNCNRCEADYFGLSRCDETGCHPCHCGIASVTSQCHDLSGQCECKPGVTGRRCEHCAQGFWNYGPEGCQPCACNTEYAIGMGCDPQTGQCSCLPGVEGEKCERCPYRWVLTERGCHRCTSCQHQLLDETDRMAAILNPVKKDFDDVAVSYFTTQKMTYFNQTAADLEKSVALLDPTKENLKPYYTTVGELENSAKSYKQKAESITVSLKDKVDNSLALRLRSVQVESKVQDATVNARRAVAETKQLLEGLKAKEQLTSPQTEAAITDARAIIERMLGVRFDSTETDSEKELAQKVLTDVKEFVKPLQELGNELKVQAEAIVKTRNKLRDIRNESDYSIGQSFKARDIINQIKEGRYPAKIALLTSQAKDMQNNLESAESYNQRLPPAIQQFNQTSNDLDQVLSSVRELKDRQEQSSNTLLNELSNNKDTLYISHEHAKALKRQADSLDRMFDDSKRTSESAFAAATAYQNIIDALAESERLSTNAKGAADNATDIINGLEQAASQALEPSRNLRVLSSEAVSQVDDKLKIPLRDAKLLIADIGKITDRTNNSLNTIAEQLDRTNVATPGTVDLDKSTKKSSDAIEKAIKTLASISNVVAKLPDDESKAKQLPITVTDLNRGVEVSSNQLRGAKDSIPLSVAITENLAQKKPFFDQKKEEIGNLLAELKARIRSARELAGRIQVGMNFNESSTLVAANPQSLDAQQIRTEMSFYFKTKDPYGLLLFLGNEVGRRPENDFIAIEIDGGYPVLTLDLGSGQQRFIIHEKYVADDKWYKAGVDRHGRRVKFTISEETNEGRPIEYASSDYYRQGTKSLLNVDRNSSKLFVGGFPPGQFRNPVRHSSYRGIIEDLRIGGQRVGLWNFNDAHHVFPAEERDRFLNLQPERGLRFLGNGYAIMNSRQYRFAQEAAVRLSFRTRAPNGLMFLVGKGKKFMSLEIVNGRVVFQYNLGSGTGSITSPEVYNDGRWHKIDAVREKTDGILRINDGPPRAVRSPPSSDSLPTTDYMYFGGYPGKHEFPEVTNKDFDGCIDNVMIGNLAVDLTGATDTRDTMVGCPPSQIEQVATFYGDGYLKVPIGDAITDGPVVSRPSDEQFELNFRFRSNSTNGLIFYGSDPSHDNFVSVSLENGALHIVEKGGTKLKSQPLNDANWHVVTVTRDRSKLIVNVDDAEDLSKDAPGGPVMLTEPGSVLLFGGRPPDYSIPSSNAASTSAFQGCLTDINFNGKRVTFGDSESVGTSVSQNCFTGENRPESIISPTISSREEGEEEVIRPPAPTRRTTTTTLRPKIPIDDDEFPDIIFESEETTTRKPKNPDEPKPTPFQQCALPLRTKLPLDDTVLLQDGIRFGNFERTSRLEFQEPQSDGSSAEYMIDFKTTSPNGLILMKTNPVSNDFIALYLLGGSVHFAFDPGSSMALLNSSSGFNDGRWHSVTVSQLYKDGSLKIDGREVARGSSGGQTRDINAGTTLFIGGLSEQLWTIRDTGKKLQGMTSPFKGCLRNLWSKNSGNTIMEPYVKHSIEPCTDETEPGFFFYPNGGYMTIGNNFRVFQRFKISLKVKPRTPTGLIFAVHGRRDYLVLQIVNGTVKFTVDNGKGALMSSFTKDPYDLCDGQWHTIQAGKTKNVVTLSVDNTFALPGIGSAGTTWTDTNNPLYFGGHPSPYSKPGIETTEQFVGCIKDVTIEGNKTALSFNYDTIYGNVAQHSCPTD